jgi:hypothetical protein
LSRRLSLPRPEKLTLARITEDLVRKTSLPRLSCFVIFWRIFRYRTKPPYQGLAIVWILSVHHAHHNLDTSCHLPTCRETTSKRLQTRPEHLARAETVTSTDGPTCLPQYLNRRPCLPTCLPRRKHVNNAPSGPPIPSSASRAVASAPSSSHDNFSAARGSTDLPARSSFPLHRPSPISTYPRIPSLESPSDPQTFPATRDPRPANLTQDASLRSQQSYQAADTSA